VIRSLPAYHKVGMVLVSYKEQYVVVVVVDDDVVVVVVVAYRIMVGCCRSEDELPFVR